nr:unnamed protein product [Callosobruchus analis]
MKNRYAVSPPSQRQGPEMQIDMIPKSVNTPHSVPDASEFGLLPQDSGPPAPAIQYPHLGLYGGRPVTRQPMPGARNMRPGAEDRCPGLECLATVDMLLVHQKAEIVEVLTGYETGNP